VSLLRQFLLTTLPHEGALILQRWKRSLLHWPDAWRAGWHSRGGPPAPSAAMSQLHEAQKQLAFGPCEILKSKTEIDKSSRFLKDQGLVLNECDAKNWDLAHLLPKLGHGNILDMGCQGSIVLENAQRLGLIGEKVGIDLVALPPRPGITLIQGDLTKTSLPSAHFDYITCLSVIEHGVDVHAFILECARLLKPGGKLFLTFDYWDPKILTDIRIFGLPWTLFCRNDVENLIAEGRTAGLHSVAPMDWTQRDGVIHSGNWAPGNFAYTFGITEFVKNATAEADAAGSSRLREYEDTPGPGVGATITGKLRDCSPR
jgi:SAM-dependent methyltransferase